MKKIVLTMVFVFALAPFSTISAKEAKVDNKLSNVDCVAAAFYYQSYLEYLDKQTDDSLTCWAFKQWLIGELNKVSKDKALINSTAEAMKELCEIANKLGWL